MIEVFDWKELELKFIEVTERSKNTIEKSINDIAGL